MNQPEFLETETWHGHVNLKTGTFSQMSPLKWEACRERFACDMSKPGFKSFYFVGINTKTQDIANFIFKTEEILDLPERTTYHRTTSDKILKVNMTDFWLGSYIRRSLFTLLMRLGSYYNSVNDNYETILFNPSVLPSPGYINTVDAVKRFMYGATSYDGDEPEIKSTSTLDTGGWCKTFRERNSWKLLVKDNDNRPSPVSFGKLWGQI